MRQATPRGWTPDGAVRPRRTEGKSRVYTGIDTRADPRENTRCVSSLAPLGFPGSSNIKSRRDLDSVLPELRGESRLER